MMAAEKPQARFPESLKADRRRVHMGGKRISNRFEHRGSFLGTSEKERHNAQPKQRILVTQ